jgi:glycosyltransferase involved in cell wall biosynthesis
MLGVVVPACNEEEHIGACLRSLRIAARCPRLNDEKVLIVVALDACTDHTARIARSWGTAVVSVNSRNVGIARACGARHALDAGARWLAFTDADSVVAPDWLSAQLAQRSDAVCGTVEVRDWGSHGEATRRHFAATYIDADGHRHIHGANLGVTALAYENVGGFQPLENSEDVALVEALRVSGAIIAWSAAPRVTTSARRGFRAPGGFGETLARIGRGEHVPSAAPADRAWQIDPIDREGGA